jgi:purine-binding chemotaxis protein CheW
MTDSAPEAKEAALLLRQVLAEANAASNAHASEFTQASAGEFVCFTIHDQLYALATTQVSAILGISPLTELPHAPAHLCGVLSHQGRIVAVVDVAILDGREPLTHAKRILIVDGAGLDAGIRVSEVLELTRLDATSVEPVSEGLSPPEHVVGQFRRGDGIGFVMDAARLLERVRQRVRGSELMR